MSDKTEIFQVSFFMINKSQTISIKTKMTIGRSEGDVIINDSKLSSKHCELNPKGLNLFIKDLNSTNGVYVNKIQIPANKEFRLNVGDIVRLGNEEFTFQDSDTPAVKPLVTASGHQERRSQSAGNAIGRRLTEVLSFFAITKEWKGNYLLLILLTAVSWVINLEIKYPVPVELMLLSQMYTKLLLSNGIRNIVLVWILCLGHAYIVSVYIKSSLNRSISLIPLFILVVNIVNFVDGPAWFIKNYVESRHAMAEFEKKKTAIVDLKKIVNAKVSFQRAFLKIDPMLVEAEKLAMEKDYTSAIKNIDAKIDSLKARPDK
jgi:hypothetical protein